jgi:hypothetical protein
VEFTKIRGGGGGGGGGGCTDGDTCPAKFGTDRDTFVIVGREITDPAERAGLGIGPGETAVEIPRHISPEAE